MGVRSWIKPFKRPVNALIATLDRGVAKRSFSIAFAFFGVSMVIAGVEAGLISRNYISFAENFVWFVASAAVAALYFFRQQFQAGDARLLSLGIAYVALGTAVHRGFYALWRILRALGLNQAADAQIEFAPYVMLLPICLVLIGYGYHTRPLWVATWGRDWAWRMTISMTVVFMSLVAIASGVGLVWANGGM